MNEYNYIYYSMRIKQDKNFKLAYKDESEIEILLKK